MSFTNPYFPLTDIVIMHIVYINETNPYTGVKVFGIGSTVIRSTIITRTDRRVEG
jgi:hypothetical protein